MLCNITLIIWCKYTLWKLPPDKYCAIPPKMLLAFKMLGYPTLDNVCNTRTVAVGNCVS